MMLLWILPTIKYGNILVIIYMLKLFKKMSILQPKNIENDHNTSTKFVHLCALVDTASYRAIANCELPVNNAELCWWQTYTQSGISIKYCIMCIVACVLFTIIVHAVCTSPSSSGKKKQTSVNLRAINRMRRLWSFSGV